MADHGPVLTDKHGRTLPGRGCTERTIDYGHATDGRLVCTCGRRWWLSQRGWVCVYEPTEEPW